MIGRRKRLSYLRSNSEKRYTDLIQSWASAADGKRGENRSLTV